MSAPLLEGADLAIGHRPGGRRRPPAVVAEGLDLELEPGRLVCLLGPNGAGKSTLLGTLAGRLPPLAGTVTVAGERLEGLAPRERARQLALVLTEGLPPSRLSGRDLVALGRHPHTGWSGRLGPEDERAVDRALDAVGATALAGRPVTEMSDGERQRVMLARALAQEARILLLDEVTAFLDLPRRVEVMHLLRDLARDEGRAVLLSTHDLDLALRHGDRLWLMSPGGGFVSGVPEDLVTTGAFDATFRTRGVAFDPASGSFLARRKPGLRIRVVGDPVAKTWVGRALEREGFTLAAEAVLEVETTLSPDGVVWSMARPGDAERRTSGTSVASLLSVASQAAAAERPHPARDCRMIEWLK